jgi:hypothetical protein
MVVTGWDAMVVEIFDVEVVELVKGELVEVGMMVDGEEVDGRVVVVVVVAVVEAAAVVVVWTDVVVNDVEGGNEEEGREDCEELVTGGDEGGEVPGSEGALDDIVRVNDNGKSKNRRTDDWRREINNNKAWFPEFPSIYTAPA